MLTQSPRVVVLGGVVTLAAALTLATCVDPEPTVDPEPAPPRTSEAAPPRAEIETPPAPAAEQPAADEPEPTGTPVHGYRVVAEFPHDPGAFTQGLLYADGGLYESTGQYRRSTLRFCELETGRVLRQRRLADGIFAEGLAKVDANLVQLTWMNHLGIVYEAATFQPLDQFRYSFDGWGLAYDGRRLIVSDGSATLRFLDPIAFAPLGTLTVLDEGRPVPELNELEVIDGVLWANIWHSERIARIDLATGAVQSWVDLTGLIDLPPEMEGGEPQNVLNGIAWDAEGERLFVTGKHWPKLFQIEVDEQPR